MKLSNLKVLIIDDVQTIRNLLTKNLNELGITTIEASDSSMDSWKIILEGIESNAPVDLVLCDWNMPKGDGIDLLEKIRSQEDGRVRLTKFIMITGANDKVLRAMDMGANNIIHKPFNTQKIYEKLELIFDNIENSL